MQSSHSSCSSISRCMQCNAVSFIVMMDEEHCQGNGIFKNVLFNMRTGHSGEPGIDFLMSHCLKRWVQEMQDEKKFFIGFNSCITHLEPS